MVAGCRFLIPGLDASSGAPYDGGPHIFDLFGVDVADVDLPSGVVPTGLGFPCDSGATCASGFCVDGVCCDSDCGSLCHACNQPSFLGHCAVALAGTDPRNQCSADSMNSCGKNGQCDGKGGCQLWSRGTACGSASCASGRLTPAPSCDGAGKCNPSASISCSPYACAGATACATSCSGTTGCQSPFTCSGNTCGLRADGQPCNGTAQCNSNHCSQGVCCDVDCSATCMTCDLNGSVGVCTAVSAGGADPRGGCTAQPVSGCGRDGSCDGAGGCELYPMGTQCAGQKCQGATMLSARSCDGQGTCSAGSMTQCDPFTCDSNSAACFTSCIDAGQCASGLMCRRASGTCK
jgi:hypothetical protein